MKSWKLRLLMAFVMVAVVLSISIPAMAEDIEVVCEADDGFCDAKFTVDSPYQDVDSEPQEEIVEKPVIEESDEKLAQTQCASDGSAPRIGPSTPAHRAETPGRGMPCNVAWRRSRCAPCRRSSCGRPRWCGHSSPARKPRS